MKIVKDLRVLNAICKRYNIIIDKDYKYITSNPYKTPYIMEYKGKQYKAKYFDGCFSPFIVEVM